MAVIYFILLMGVIVTIHEFGHLITAKLFKVYCYEFSIGMGFKLFGFKGKETEYSIRFLPIGGYVAMAGEDDNDRGIEVPYNRTIKGIARWKQIIVMLAGVAMNFLLAWILVSGLMLFRGSYVTSPKPIVEDVLSGSVADEAGFKTNDIIKKVVFSDNTEIIPKTFNDILPFIQTSDKPVTYIVERDNEIIEITAQGIYDVEREVYLIGIKIPNGEEVQVNLLNAPLYGIKYLGTITKGMFISLFRLLKGTGLNQISGPVGVYNVTKQSVELGIGTYINLMALFSLNIGIFNLLPLPVLDGGRAIITFVEMILNKSINKKIEFGLMAGSWILLLTLMIFATYQDIIKLF